MALLDGAGVDLDLGGFDGRLCFQKVMYLLQELGVSLGFSFGWYCRGPYSDGAAGAGFDIRVIQQHVEVELPPVRGSDVERLGKLRLLLDLAKIELIELPFPERLELLASLHFVYHHSYERPRDGEEAVQKLLRLRPMYSLSQTRRALSVIEMMNAFVA